MQTLQRRELAVRSRSHIGLVVRIVEDKTLSTERRKIRRDLLSGDGESNRKPLQRLAEDQHDVSSASHPLQRRVGWRPSEVRE